jgi:hypothetical protein
MAISFAFLEGLAALPMHAPENPGVRMQTVFAGNRPVEIVSKAISGSYLLSKGLKSG